MSYARQFTVAVVASSTGGATANSTFFSGHIRTVIYSASTGGSTAATLTVDTVDSGQSVLAAAGVDGKTSAQTFSPVQNTHTTTGGKVGVSTTGGPNLPTPIYAANEALSCTIASAGANATGTFRFIIA